MSALEAAQAELAEGMYPLPETFMEALTPAGALYYLWETAKSALVVATAAASSLQEPGDEPQPVTIEILNGVAAAVAGACHACVALGVLPPEAEEAMAGGR